MLPQNAVKLLFLSIVCLLLFSDVVAGRKRTRPPSRSPSPVKKIGNRVRSGVSSAFKSYKRTGAASSSRGDASTSRSDASTSRSRTTRKEVDLPMDYAVIDFEDNLYNTLYQWHHYKGDDDLLPRRVSEQKVKLEKAVKNDICRGNPYGGANLCAQALTELQRIPRNFRGPCGEAFAGICHNWPWNQGCKCSLLMKDQESMHHRDGSPTATVRRIGGRVYPLNQCVQAVHPEDYADAYNQADQYLNPT